MENKEYVEKITALSTEADDILEALDKESKKARSEHVQSMLNERKHRVANVYRQKLDALDVEFFGEQQQEPNAV